MDNPYPCGDIALKPVSNISSSLVVCDGNHGRSPMGEALLRVVLGKEMTIGSVGLTALHGYPADPLAQTTMAERGQDLSSRCGYQLTALIAFATDFILVMDERQEKNGERMDTSIRSVSTSSGIGNRFSIGIPLTPLDRAPRPSRKPWQKSNDLLQTGFLA